MRKLHKKEVDYDCPICNQKAGTHCVITRGKNKGKIAATYHEWGRRPAPRQITAYRLGGQTP